MGSRLPVDAPAPPNATPFGRLAQEKCRSPGSGRAPETWLAGPGPNGSQLERGRLTGPLTRGAARMMATATLSPQRGAGQPQCSLLAQSLFLSQIPSRIHTDPPPVSPPVVQGRRPEPVIARTN